MNQNSTTAENVQDRVQHSKPIPISTQHLRHRSASLSSESSSSSTSSPPLLTPKNLPTTRISNSPSSPILYFLSQSPSKSPATFPFRGFPPPPVPEDHSEEDNAQPTHAHARRASTASRFPPPPSMQDPRNERGVNLLRRLSLGGNFAKPPAADIPPSGTPQTPPNSAAIANNSLHNVNRKARRSATITEQTRPRRAPSPMGERILKGHFDGFN